MATVAKCGLERRSKTKNTVIFVLKQSGTRLSAEKLCSDISSLLETDIKVPDIIKFLFYWSF